MSRMFSCMLICLMAFGFLLNAPLKAEEAEERPQRRLPRISHRIYIRPIQASRSDGSEPANPERQRLEEATAAIFAQAGVEPVWLPWQTWQNDRALNGILDQDMPLEDMLAEAPLFPDAFVVNMIFTSRLQNNDDPIWHTSGRNCLISSDALAQSESIHLIACALGDTLGLNVEAHGALDDPGNLMQAIAPTALAELWSRGGELAHLTHEQIHHLHQHRCCPIIQSE